MPWHRFVFTKRFWTADDGRFDFLGSLYMSGIATFFMLLLVPFAAFFDAAQYPLFAAWFFMALAALSWMLVD